MTHLADFRFVFCMLLLLSCGAAAGANLPEIEDVELLAISDEIKTLLDKHLRPLRTKKEKTEALHAFLFKPNQQNIVYDFSTTLNAQQTFDQKRGNCLSQAVLYAAAARYLGLKVEFQSVKTRGTWEKQEGFYLVPEHINVHVKLPGRRRATVEFLSPQFHESGKSKTRKIRDEQVLADFYNNKGIEALQNKNTRLALAYFLKSVEVRDRSAYAWSNIGTAYKLLEQFSEAEKAYLKAHKLNKRDTNVVLNLYALYQQIGDEEKARQYFSRVEKYQKALNKRLPE